MSLRVLVVGAGGVGSAAARFLAGEGHAVTLLERFGIDHDRGSSFGSSRIIRRVYPDRFYTLLMDSAYPLWEELEREAGERLLLKTGGLFFGPEGHPELAKVRDALDANAVPYEVLNSGEADRRFPAFQLEPGEVGIYQEDGGILNASACVRANVRLAQEHGAEIREHTLVERIELGGESVGVRLADGSVLDADRLILAAGPWMNELLSPYVRLPLTVTRQVYCHFDPQAHSERFVIGQFPIWIDFGTNFYGFPHERHTPGVKVAWHEHGRATDPDAVDREVREADRDPLRRYCAGRFPDLSPAVAHEKVCLYTNTPDEDFVVDRLPHDPRVIVMSPCSGHGFKFTVLMGRIAAWMAAEESIPWELDRFSLTRFGKFFETAPKPQRVTYSGFHQAQFVQNLIHHKLEKITVREGGWVTLYKDPQDGSYWELSYPQGELHGGGPPLLIKLLEGEAESLYNLDSS